MSRRTVPTSAARFGKHVLSAASTFGVAGVRMLPNWLVVSATSVTGTLPELPVYGVKSQSAAAGNRGRLRSHFGLQRIDVDQATSLALYSLLSIGLTPRTVMTEASGVIHTGRQATVIETVSAFR